MEKTQQIRAVIFDIDGTLTPEVSWLSLTRDLGGSVDGHLKIHHDYKNGIISYEQSKKDLITMWRATGNAKKSVFRTLFEQWPLADKAQDTVAKLQDRFKVCLITGSMDLYAETVAAKLGVEQWHANTILHWDDEENITDMDYTLDQSGKKLEQFLAFCAEHQLTPEQCIPVGDSENDIGLFELSGRGIAIGPEIPGELSRHAWKTIGNIEELAYII